MMADSLSHAARSIAGLSEGNLDRSSKVSSNLTTESDCCLLSFEDAAAAAEEMEIHRQIEKLGSVYLEDGDDAVSLLLQAAHSGDANEIKSILNTGIDVDATRTVSYFCLEK
jgi:hypothetical protein